MSEQTKKSRHMTMCGTEGWVAPEILLGMSYDTSCDVFSYGVVLAELITGRKPGVDLWVRSPETCFDINPNELKQKAFEGCPPKLIDICNECCMYEPLARPKFEEILAQLKPVQIEVKETLAAKLANVSISTPPTTTTTTNTTIPIINTIEPQQQQNNNNNNENRSPDLTNGQPSLLLAQGRRNTMSLHRKSMEITQAMQDTYKKSTLAVGASPDNKDPNAGWKIGEFKPPGYYTLKRRQQTQTLPNQGAALSNHIVKMVERATSDYHYDTSYIQDLLLTYRCFTTPKHIFDLLLNRYIVNSPENYLSDINQWKKVQKVIQLRVIIFLKRWIDYYPLDFLEESMEDKLLEFDKISAHNNTALLNLTSTLVPSNELAPKLHPELLKKRVELDQEQQNGGSGGGSPNQNTTEIMVGNSVLNINNAGPNQPTNMQYPVSIIPPPPSGNQEYLEVIDMHPHELSRQLTIIMGTHFKAIKTREFLEYCWEKLSDTASPWIGGAAFQTRPAPNIHKFQEKYRDLVKYLSTEIVKHTTSLQKRVATIEKFIEAAEKCLTHYDYSSVFCLMEVLTDTSIERLNDTFKSISPRITQIYDNLRVFVSKDNDYKKYRESIQDCQPPCIPHVTLLLDELTFISTSSPKLLPGGIVNFFHYRQLSRKILQTQQLISPNIHYFRPIPSIQKALSKPPQELYDNEVIKHYSLICEPPVSIN